MEGGSFSPDPEETAKLLNLLNEVGLTGSRLAVSHGSESTLARQLADRLGLEPKPWHATFVMGQVREAVQMADLDDRLAGSTSSRSVQNLFDAKVAMEKRKEMTLEPDKAASIIPVIPKRGTLGRTVRLRSGRVAAEDEVNDKVLDRLVGELMYYEAPVLEEVKKAMNPTRAKEALLGKYRISTVRRYLASWQRFREWTDSMGRSGQRPTSVTLVDYMYAREEEAVYSLGRERGGSLVRKDGWNTRGGAADVPILPPDGHERADTKARAKGSTRPAGAPLDGLLCGPYGDAGGGRSHAL